MHECPSSGIASGIADMAGAIDMDAAHPASEHPAEIDDRARAMDGGPNAVRVGDVRRLRAELADLAQGLDDVGLARIALGDAHPDPGFEQEFADIAADESTAAEDGYKLFRPIDHGRRLCPAPPALTRRAAAL